MPKKKLWVFIVVFTFCIAITFSQSGYEVSGEVLDENGAPLWGASIFFPELQKGTVSDSLGKFFFSGLPAGILSMKISYLAYETVILSVDTDHPQLPVHVQLKPSPIQGRAVVISGGRYSSQHENAIKIEAISQREILLSGATSFMESITRLPGVSLISGGGGVSTPVIRGLSTSNILFLNNGIRMENYQFSENHPYLADEFGVNQVEVIKGPASLLYGSDAIGGVINSIPEPPAPVGQMKGEAGIQYFTNTSGISGTLGFKNSSDKFSWGLRSGLKSHKDYYDASNDFIPNTRFGSKSIKAFGSCRINRGILRLHYEYLGMEAGLCNEESINLVTGNARKNEFWFQDLNNHLVATKNTFFFTHYKLMINASYQLNGRKLVGSETSYDNLLANMSLHTFNLDIRNIYSRTENAEYTLAVQAMSQINRNHEAVNRILPDYTFHDLAMFGMAQYKFSGSIHIQVGLRFDNRLILVPEQEKSGHTHEEHSGDEEELMEALDKYFSNVSGSVGFTWKLTENLLFRSNLASAYRSPNIAELTQDGVHGTRYEQGSRDLKSQRNYELDISMHNHRKKVLIDISGFYNEIRDYIFLDYTSDTTDEGLRIFRYRQNNAMIYGTELEIELLPLKFLSLKGSYSYLRGQQHNGENLPFIPQNKLSGEIKWEKSGRGFLSSYYMNCAIEYAFRQDQPSLFEMPTADYTLVNAGIGLSFLIRGQNLNFDLTATNLLNNLYINHLSTLKNLGFYNMGRNIMVSIKVPFDIFIRH